MQAVTVSVENQKRALQLKYLLHLSNQQNQSDLLNTLNKLYPFTEYPLPCVPPVEMIQTDPLQIEVEQFIDDQQQSPNANKHQQEEISREKIMRILNSDRFSNNDSLSINITKEKKKKMRKLTQKEIQAQQKVLSTNLKQQIAKYSYIILTGGMVIQKRQHRYVQNRYVGQGIEDQIFFNINEGEVTLSAMRSTCYLRIHNIWIDKAKKKHKADMEQYAKHKLLQIPFFANLSFRQFQKCFKTAYIKILGPGDVLLESGATPYHLYVVAQGELVFEKSVKFLKDYELWTDVKNQLQRQEDNTCQQMFKYLVKQPKPHEQLFQVIFKIKSASQNEIICAKETLCQQNLTYSIVSSLKTKLICIKYPDLYNLDGDRLAEIRNWETFDRKDIDLRRDFYYQMKWSQFKEETKRQCQLNRMQRQRFEDFLRKDISLNPDKAYYCPNKIGEGSIIDNPAGKVSKLKAMSYLEQS